VRSDPDFYNKATVDKYGRRISKDEGKKAIDRLYEVDDEDEDEDDEDEDEELQQPLGKKRDKAVAKELARVQKQGFDPIRDGGLESSSDESSSDEDDQEVEEETELAGEGNDVPTGDISARLAAVNMDWDNMRAIDIMGVANSFVPADGRILNVVIYPSEFGMERMQREEIEGPPREIFASSSKTKDDIIAVDDSENSGSEAEDGTKEDLRDEDTGEEFDSTALRSYQLDRLRYYYAVITCSSANVAKSIYDNLDGREYLTSANFFDLRFVPDGTTFDQDRHDECDKLPDNYKPNEFSTDALTHSKVRLTWDADDTTRKEVQKRAFSRKDIDENELKAYLGSDSSSSEDEVETAKADKASKLRAALGLDAPGKTSKPKQKASSKRDRDFPKPDGEMEITFTGGLLNDASKGGSVFENEIPIYETTMEKYVRKEKERKAKRKERAKAKKEGRDPDADAEEPTEAVPAGDADVEDPFNDPFFASDPEEMERAEKAEKAESKKSKKTKRREEEEEQAEATAAERANLELLMAGEDDAKLRHFDMKEIAKAEKAKKKGKKAKKAAPVVEDNFKINTTDPRFAELYESHEFAIDPTNPRFKETTGMKALLEEGRKKRKQVRADEEPEDDRESKKSRKAEVNGGDEDVKKLAARIKAKSKQK
jgi:hypothetical protein